MLETVLASLYPMQDELDLLVPGLLVPDLLVLDSLVLDLLAADSLAPGLTAPQIALHVLRFPRSVAGSYSRLYLARHTSGYRQAF